MDSNSSMRCLVLPWRIWRRVLYLSRPAFTFSAWIRSLGVFLLSSTAPASSVLRNWKRTQTHSERDPLCCESLGDYSEALPLSRHPMYAPQSPSENTLLSIVIKSSCVLSPLRNIISCFGCEIESYFISFVIGLGLDEICDLNETNRIIMYLQQCFVMQSALSCRWNTLFGGNYSKLPSGVKASIWLSTDNSANAPKHIKTATKMWF